MYRQEEKGCIVCFSKGKNIHVLLYSNVFLFGLDIFENFHRKKFFLNFFFKKPRPIAVFSPKFVFFQCYHSQLQNIINVTYMPPFLTPLLILVVQIRHPNKNVSPVTLNRLHFERPTHPFSVTLTNR